MKLLLTSGGFTNTSIINTLHELLDKPFAETTLTFIPTAANYEKGDKSWFINDLCNIQKLRFKSVEITDISAVDRSIWEPSVRRADVLFFEGGNTYYLMEWLSKSGLSELLPTLLQDKVYVGLSAGSMITCKDLALDISQLVYGEDLDRDYVLAGLNLVDFYFLPHLNSPYFPNLRESFIRKTVQNYKKKVYAMDDMSALKVADGAIEVVSEGKWICLENGK